ncbi:ECF transporter S component [Clostridium aminobutyricum]|uniref:ECF transporter S component n=1 Tax=Clostridium aminobutyricum TaxID=33953 RepID=A0A939DAE2_CLOAM|nr:ECF transporter S component [Clostridium aminobutyricum]MBN7773658.1 ECF transporter S component [Clostridium aminobutyricum]
MKQDTTIKRLCETALFTALVFLGIFTFKFPLPFGYVHLGDSMIFLAVLMLGGKRGALAGGIGGALADLISGYAIWMLPTFLCKFFLAICMGIIIEKQLFKLEGKSAWLVGGLLGGLVQTIGYMIASYVLYGMPAVVVAIPSLAFQSIAGLIIALVVAAALQKTALQKYFLHRANKKVSNEVSDSL